MKTVLILGAGTSGIVAASELRKRLGNKARIIIIEKQRQHIFAPSLLWLMVGKRTQEGIERSNERLSKYGELVFGEIESIDAPTKSARVNGASYTGDYMVVALGAETRPPQELERFGHNLYSSDGAAAFYQDLRCHSKGTIAFVVSSLPFKCPAAPYEAAMLVDAFVRSHASRSRIPISLFSPEPGPMPVAGQIISDAVRSMLRDKDIGYFPNRHLVSAEGNALHFAGGESASFDLLGYIPRHFPHPAILNAGVELTPQGWIRIDSRTMATSVPGVFATGDITSVTLPNGKLLPKAGVFAHEQAEAVACTIADDILGKNCTHRFEGRGACFLETGGGQAGYATGNFYASPDPQITMKKNGALWHWLKVAFEKYWFFKYF